MARTTPFLELPILQYPVSAAGIVTRVLECGTGDRAVVCVHGAGSRADRFRPTLPRLAALGYRVFAVDLPGHGLADKPADYPYRVDSYADVVDDVLEQIVLPASGGVCRLVGTSLGGHVAAAVTVRRPQVVASLVLVGAVGLVARGDGDRPSGSPITAPGEAGTRQKLEFLVADPSLVTDAWVREEHMINGSSAARSALQAVAAYSAGPQDDELSGPALAECGVRTLLCWGEADRWVPVRLGHRSREILPDAAWVTIADAGHAPYFERPDAFVDVVSAFWSAQD